ncbi:PH domain-containing protein [Glycomyces sp. NPDC049804]|uniref:PH domain-containing protein n=1 Tax=Glycomyces sp. NPDC049804 TaxID=3154363 RepID=UPI00341308E5
MFLTVRPEMVLPDSVIEYRYLLGGDRGADSGWAISYLHLIWVLLPLWAGWSVLAWYLARFSISNKRLIKASGVISLRYTTVALGRSTDAQLRQSLLGRILNYGTVQLYGINWFHPMRRTTCLPNPNELYLQLLEEIYEPEAVEERVAAIEAPYRAFDRSIEEWDSDDPEPLPENP